MAHIEHPRGLHNDNAICESCKFSRGLIEFQHASRMLETEQIIMGGGGGEASVITRFYAFTAYA